LLSLSPYSPGGSPLIVTHLVYAVLAIVLVAMAVPAIVAISKIEERGHLP